MSEKVLFQNTSRSLLIYLFVSLKKVLTENPFIKLRIAANKKGMAGLKNERI